MKFLYFLSAFILTHPLQAQTETFTTNGNQLVDPCDVVFMPRGVNYSLADDWNFPSNLNDGRERSAEIVQANPNTVRIQWYVDYGNASRPALTLEGLDSVITRFARANVVSILELHDFTHIHTDTTAFNNELISWWTSPEVLDLIDKHKSHLLVNIANEYGPALYPAPNYTLNPNYAAEITTWVQHYKSCISYLRNAGITVPIIIDAANYGMDYQAVIDYGSEFNTHDPLNRIVMSCHAYWNSNAAGMESIVAQLSVLTVPVIFGEVGNVDFSCSAIEMDAFLLAAQNYKMGWLAWTWNRDECATRNMTANITNDPNSTTDGKFSTLTAYGNTIVNNSTYGLATTALKPVPGCLVSINELENNSPFHVFPNPATTRLNIETDEKILGEQITISDIHGREVHSLQVIATLMNIELSHWDAGIYFLHLSNGRKIDHLKFIVSH